MALIHLGLVGVEATGRCRLPASGPLLGVAGSRRHRAAGSRASGAAKMPRSSGASAKPVSTPSWASPRARRHRARCAAPELCATMAELRFQARGSAGTDTEQDDDFAATHREICLSEGQVFPVAHRQPCNRKHALPWAAGPRGAEPAPLGAASTASARGHRAPQGAAANPECRHSLIVATPWWTQPDLAELPPALAARGCCLG
jgi:hypothetical protein